MSSSTVELRPNRNLLDHDFEGYKLTLQALPHWTYNLAVAVDQLHPDEIQYSFLHAKLFALHNHLVADPWDPRCLYFIDKNQQVSRCFFNTFGNSFEQRVVYDVPAHVERKSGHFNLCLTFPTDRLALVTDGTGYLHIISTTCRLNFSQKDVWKTLFSCLVLGKDNYFIIIDSRAEELDEKVTLHCLLQSVEQNEKHFSSVLTWVTFESTDGNWKQTSIKQLQGKGIVHYAAIEKGFKAIYVASDNQFKFSSDSEREITEAPVSVPQEKKIIYTWLQTSEDITVSLKLPEGYDKKLFHVNVTPLAIKLSYGGETYLDGKLSHALDSELTTWNIESGRADILLTKSESMIWQELVKGGDPNGEQIMDPSLVAEVHQRLMHLCSETEVTGVDQSAPGLSTQELEECDAASEEDTVLVRFDAETHAATHRSSLSVHQYLFTLNLYNDQVPALALRHDVDACIWQPYAMLEHTSNWPIKHEGTLSAFGYIQSSKQNRKFITCPPDFSYSVVCEATRHIFIYRRNGNQDSQLRQRTGGVMKTVNVGQQHVFNIDKSEVLGLHAAINNLYVLTDDKLIRIEIS